ncbi:hypothetical protein [Amycolatopsis sp. CA-128772]|uniref:hypothetical protein n=1 Tax=Amycolatopsis sp. CA-128772 TaxID=2073159 RepID=UPI000CD0B8C5|nr:hypothetical protein [Amycolatopsis sp. CA-128772]
MRRDERDPPAFDRREVVIPPDRSQALGPGWPEGLVVVRRGTLEVLTADGGHARFAAGSVLAFSKALVPAIRGGDGKPAVLVVVSRRCPAPRTAEDAEDGDRVRGR